MQLSANGIRLEVEDHGPTHGEPLLLVMGLGMQLLGWHEDLVALGGRYAALLGARGLVRAA